MNHTPQVLVDLVFARLSAGGVSYRQLQAATKVSKDTLATWRKKGAPKRITRPLQAACQYLRIHTNSDDLAAGAEICAHPRLARVLVELGRTPHDRADAVADLLERVAALVDR